MAMFASSLLTLLTINYFYPVIPISNGTSDIINKPGKSIPQEDSLTAKDLKKLETTYSLIHSQYVSKIDHDKILNGAITGMLAATDDPFSTYMTPEEAKDFQDNVDALFEGIGAELSIKEDKVTINFIIKGTPAEKVGLKMNDIIVSVNGDKLEGLTLSQASAKIRGPKGTQAELSILRPGVIDPINIIVVRDEVERQTAKGIMLTADIGKIEIGQFSIRTLDEFNLELTGLEKQGMKALIIDVRNDPGGLLNTVVDIAGTFIDKGKTIVQTEDRDGKRQVNLSEINSPARKYPIAVLINKGSASASEILAAALQQSAGSKLVGETSYGKGTVQDKFDEALGDGSNLKLTVDKWLTPNGTWIHKKGLTPDVIVAQPDYFDVLPLSKKTTLKFDMNNEDVKSMQVMLQGLGFDPLRKDGYFDSRTIVAVREFQAANKLTETGEVDVITAEAIEAKIITEIMNIKNDMQLNAAISLLESTLSAP